MNVRSNSPVITFARRKFFGFVYIGQRELDGWKTVERKGEASSAVILTINEISFRLRVVSSSPAKYNVQYLETENMKTKEKRTFY
jgi:hypothetical protein